jgi:hypothetical protein
LGQDGQGHDRFPIIILGDFVEEFIKIWWRNDAGYTFSLFKPITHHKGINAADHGREQNLAFFRHLKPFEDGL